MDIISPIRTKKRMYELMAAGHLGNCCEQWFDADEWARDDRRHRYTLWGIRSLVPGDKRCQLNVPPDKVVGVFKSWFAVGQGNISPMVDMYVALRGEVWLADYMGGTPGLNLFYVPPGSPINPEDPWRGSFRNYGKTATGLVASELLKIYMWPADLEDIMMLLERYPGHVVEFSACRVPLGVIPHRRVIVWEVRLY